ncbi:MAG: hemolysin family protein [Ruminococcus sp.]|jgi:CBS domain containing-hemolysin-like protein|nr:hemolysin family protein [Ruminococcus sp.]
MNYVLIILMLIFSACFSASETAFSTVSKVRLKTLAEAGSKRAKRAYAIAENYEKTITTILIGNNIVNILSASIGTVIFTGIFGENGVGISTVVMTVAVLIFGEVLPKTYAKTFSERTSLTFAGFLSAMIWIFTPLSFLFGLIQKGVVKMAGKSTSPSITEDELKIIVGEIEDEGVLEEQESRLVRSALEFDDITAEKIFIPRTKVAAVERNDDVEKIRRIFIEERYSRLPVYEESIDNIVGILHEKDFFGLILDGVEFDNIDGIIQKALYVTELTHISEVLSLMQKTKIHMAVVKDQYGGTGGILTLEDILEELVGEIYDESDEIIPSVVKVSEGVYDVAADLNFEDFLEQINLPVNSIESEVYTIGGWAMELFGKIPEKGEIIKSGIFTVTVLESNNQAIEKLRIKIDDGE